ncbi:MAG TPA: hypothetical protein VD994_17205, partial [Prosthecobacter sp.]|nr:hypothetical protein [Prosthecobacter sp.]
DELYLHFDPAVAGKDARIIVHLAQTVEQPVASWQIAPLQPVGFEKLTARALIAAHAAMQVRLLDVGGRKDIQELDPTVLDTVFAIAPPFERKRGLRMEGATWNFEAALARQPARFSVEAVALVLVSDSGIRISQQVAALVDQGALRQVTVRMPASLPEAAVSGPLLREMRSRVEGEERIYECSFQTDVLDRTELTFDHDLPLTPTLAVPLVKVADVHRLQRFFVLDNTSAREARVTGSAALESISRDVVPYLPEGLGRPQFFRATSDDSRLTISYTELAGTEANAALVTLADITTVLRADGERWDTVVYSLVNRSLQFLPVILPKGADLISASVSGETVRADQETRGGRVMHLIPLIHTKPGQRALEVRLVWRFPPQDWRKATLDDPELAGLSAERTGWTVWTPPGYQLKDFDGNMDEVGAEDRDLQRLEGMLSELGDVNRELASGKLDYKEAKDAYSSANRLAEEIRAAKNKVINKAMSMKRLLRSNDEGTEQRKAADLEQGVSRQKELLEGKWKEYEDKGTGDRRTAGEREGKPGAKTDWMFNKTGDGTLQAPSKASNNFESAKVGEKGVQIVNDNLAVDNSFFGDQQGLIESGSGGLVLNGQVLNQTPMGQSLLNSNARANNISQSATAPDQEAGNRPVAPKPEQIDRLQAMPSGPGAPTADSDAFGVLPARPAAATPAAGDPFAAAPVPEPAVPSGTGNMMSRAAVTTGPATVEKDAAVAVLFDTASAGGVTAQTVESLRPTGRRSLALEVPQQGEARHFSKLKDHAVLELKIGRPWEPKRTRSAWILGLGALVLLGWSRVLPRRRA